MRIAPHLLFFTLVLICLGGCATVEKGSTYAEVRATAAASDKATVYVFRKYAEPTAWSMTIQIGNREVASLNQGSFTCANLTPGKYQVRGVWPGLSGQRDASIEIDVKPATVYYLEVTGISQAMPETTVITGSIVTMKSRMGSGINEVSSQVAEAALATCCTFRKPTSCDY